MGNNIFFNMSSTTYSVSQEAQYLFMWSPWILLGKLVVDYFVGGGKMLAWDFAYEGLIVNITLSFLAAGYVAGKVIDATVSASTGNFWQYAHGSTLGDYIGIYELFNVLAVLTVGPLLMAFGGYYTSNELWTRFNEIQEKGLTLSKVDGFKYMLLCFVKAFSIWVVALAVGTAASNLLSFYDTYNTKTETVHCDADGNNCTNDVDGTSLLVDLITHELEAWGMIIGAAAIVYFGDSTFVNWFDEMAVKK